MADDNKKNTPPEPNPGKEVSTPPLRTIFTRSSDNKTHTHSSTGKKKYRINRNYQKILVPISVGFKIIVKRD